MNAKTAPVDVLAVFEETSTGLHSIASECSRGELSNAMRERAEEFDVARAAVAELIKTATRAQRLLHDQAEAGFGDPAQADELHAALARVGGAA